MRLVVLLEFGILSYLVNVSSQQSIGKVHIGYPAHLNQAVADPEVYRFRENDLTGILPVFVNTINSKAAETDDVNVTCISIPDSAVGYLLVKFGGVVVSGSVGHGEVPLDILGPGREVAVTCSGESSVYNLTSGRQFEYNTSTGPARKLVVSGAATVQICGEVVLVPAVVGKFDTFRLSFSDVLESPVKIFCSAVQDQDGFSMALEFTNPEVASGVHEASISYRLLSPGVATYVICVGQSVSGDQYLNSTSGREAVSFVLDVGDIAIIPSLVTVRTTSFDAFLILDAPVADDGSGDVTFQCRVEQMDDAHQAIAASDSARCQLPSSAPAAVASRADDTGEVMTEGLPEAPTSTAADHNIEKRQVTASTSTSTSVPVTATTGTVTSGAAEGLTNEPNVEPSSTEVTGVTLGEIGTSSEPRGQVDSPAEIALTDESETVTGGDDISGTDKTPIQQTNVTNKSTANDTTTEQPNVTSASTANVTTTEQPNVATTSTASDSMTQKTNLTSPSPANGTTTEQPNVTTTSTANDSTTQETNVTSLSTANDTTMEEANASVASTGTDNTTLSHVAVNAPTSIALQPDTDMPVEPWELERETLVLREGDLFRKLALRRSSYPALPVIEYLLVTCCATPDINQNPKYTNRSAAAFVVADLQSTVVVNWTSAADVLDEDRETEMEKAEYVEVAPCVCDLSAGHCDTNCCCDTDCRAGSIASFHCKEGLPGGQPAAPYTYNCSSTHFDRAGWFPALCVQKSNTPYLGEYYPTLPALFTETSYSTLVTASRPAYTYEETGQRGLLEEGGNTQDYKHGRAIRTEVEGASFFSNYLSLPARSLDGRCVVAPLAHLVETSHACAIAADACAGAPAVDARSYALPSRVAAAFCPAAPRPRTAPPPDAPLAAVTVDYLCAGERTARRRATSLDPAAASDAPTDSVPPRGDDWYESPGEGAARCAFDDGATAPPAPALSSGTCRNAVVAVVYRLHWAGTAILKLNATVVLADVVLDATGGAAGGGAAGGGAALLTQRFAVRFVHGDGAAAERRSGNPGYELAAPVRSGVVVATANAADAWIDANRSSTLGVLRAQTNGRCRGDDAVARRVRFGEAAASGCSLRLGVGDLQDCGALDAAARTLLDDAFASTHVSRGGDPRRDHEDDWVRIVREPRATPRGTAAARVEPLTTASPEVSEMTTAQGTEEESTSESTTAAPELTPSPALLSLNINQIIRDIGKTLLKEPPGDFPLEGEAICNDMTTGAILDVLYTEAGRSNGEPIYEIIGAKISYITSTWKLSCSGAESVRCRNGSNDLESFAITTSVSFTEVPAEPPAPVKRYWQTKPPGSLCKYDTCRREILYPFTAAFAGDPLPYTTAMSLGTLLFMIGLLLVTRPWW